MTLLDVRLEQGDYGGFPVLRDIAFEANQGELVAFLGTNGAGKTTLLRAISGVMVRARGTVKLDGEDVMAVPAHERVARGLVHVPEGRRLFGGLTVTENLRMGAYLHRRTLDPRKIEQRMERVRALFPILEERRTQLASTLSGGEQQMLAIARGLMSEPRILMVDEASLGLAPLITEAVLETLAAIRLDGTCVVMVEQNAAAALGIADRAYLLERGSIVLSGTPEEFLSNPRIIDTYLGGGSPDRERARRRSGASR